MSFELHERKHIDDELKKLSRRQLRSAGEALVEANTSTFKAAVHESRKSVKKVRAILDVLERAGAKVPRKDAQRLKRAARELSALRDAAAIVGVRAVLGVGGQIPLQYVAAPVARGADHQVLDVPCQIVPEFCVA